MAPELDRNSQNSVAYIIRSAVALTSPLVAIQHQPLATFKQMGEGMAYIFQWNAPLPSQPYVISFFQAFTTSSATWEKQISINLTSLELGWSRFVEFYPSPSEKSGVF